MRPAARHGGGRRPLSYRARLEEQTLLSGQPAAAPLPPRGSKQRAGTESFQPMTLRSPTAAP